MTPLVLASASPRRAEILRTLGLDFEVRPADVDEAPIPAELPHAMAVRLAVAKARASRHEPREVCLGADTVVLLRGQALGKPTDDDDAARMLRSLSGRWHEVVTAFAVVHGDDELRDAVTTRVRFSALSEATIERYVATGEGRDKAGAYGIQGIGGGLVKCIEGSYTNVVGLPAFELLEVLRRVGPLEWP